MKRDAKEAYVQALTEHARRKTKGATQPVIVDAFRFFDEAASRVEGLYHPFRKSNAKQILHEFTDDLQTSCVRGDDGFPIIVIKIASRVIREIRDGKVIVSRHGKQAAINAEDTAEHYREAATVGPYNPYAGWALFGPDACKDHPIVGATFCTQRDRIETSRKNFNRKVADLDPTLGIGIGNDNGNLAIEASSPV